MLREQIIENLENTFSQYGFAQSSVAQLKDACNVSLRTLYKYFPSKEMMIIAALDNRHQRYLALLKSDLPNPGYASIFVIFNRLAHWLKNNTVNGCMSLNALAAFPENPEIKAAVMRHKKEVRVLLGIQSGQVALTDDLFLLHEAVSSSWATLGTKSLDSAQKMVKQLMAPC